MSERAILNMLRERYQRLDRYGVRRYAYAEHVPDRPFSPLRVADALALDCQRGSWADWRAHRGTYTEDWGYATHGFEVKVSRADWLSELRTPGKAEAWRPHLNYWWLVVSDPSIVKPGELPPGWGLMAARGPRLITHTRAPLNPTPSPMGAPMRAAIHRAIAKTATPRLCRNCAQPTNPL